MKLRLRGNSLRLRLARTEVERIGHGEEIVETTRLAGDVEFGYCLRPADGDSLRASLSGAQLVVEAPQVALAEWASSDVVALDCPTDNDTTSILIEKDFACLTPRGGSDDDDTFPHPNAGSSSC